MPIFRILTVGARLLVTTGLIWVLAMRIDLGRAAVIIAHASVPLLAAALGGLLAANLVTALRWHLILAAATPSPGPATLAKLILVGLYFNQVLPSGIGGDAVRALRCRSLGIGLGAAVRSILLDRACGYSVLIAIYAVALPCLLNNLHDVRGRSAIIAVLACGAAGLMALVSLDCLPSAILRFPMITTFALLSGEARRLLTHPRRCGAALGLSVLSIALTILSFELVADAIGSRLSFGIWAMVVPPVSLIQLLPVSLAGWGVREAALIVALGWFGVPAEAALATSVAMGLCLIAIGLPGGLIWLTNWDISRARRA